MPRAIYVDLSRCIYCRACEVACEREHDGFTGMFVIPVERLALPLSCRHCEKSPCLVVCYTQALARDAEDTVTLDRAKCTGCKLCVFACPFGVIGFDPQGKVVTKCDLCLERLEEGKEPVCVSTCPARALYYVDYEVFTGRVKRRAALTLARGIGAFSESL